jgi:hypothetical protein
MLNTLAMSGVLPGSVRTSLLVLVRWQGDIISSHTVEQGRSLQSFSFLEGYAGDPDVRVEVYDVSPERAALGKRLSPTIDLRAAYALMVSGTLHLGLAAVALVTLLVRPAQAIEVDDPNRQSGLTEDPIAHVATAEGADAGVVDPAQQEPRPTSEAEPTPPELGVTAAKLADEAPLDPFGQPVEDGSSTPGSGGTDAITASSATCLKSPVPKNTGKVCHRSVVVTSLEVPPGCFVDTVPKLGQKGTLTYPCEGDGEARLTFGTKAFAGASLGGKLEMCTGTEYPFSDGCRWTSAQRIRGRLGMGSLAFEYGEAPKVGQANPHRSCARACSASGSVRVE